MFNQRVRSPSASSSSDSPTHTQPNSLSPRRSASASAKTFAARNGPELIEKRAAVVAGRRTNTLHAKVMVFATSSQAKERLEALSFLCKALEDDAGRAESNGTLLDARDTNTLISVSAQRLRSSFSRALELFNAGKLDGKVDTTFLLATDSDERNHTLQMLLILQTLVVSGNHEQARLLVSERIPSTFVKVAKALSHGKCVEGVGGLVEVVLDVLALLVASPEAVQELNESSTLHRIFHLNFNDQKLQMTVLKVMEALVRNLQPMRWRAMAKQLYEERCLLNLVHNASGTDLLAKAVVITALSLRRAIAAGLADLHRQMHVNRQRHAILAAFVQFFEARQRVIAANDTAPSFAESHWEHDEHLADAIAELSFSGSEAPLLRVNPYQNKALKLVLDTTTTTPGVEKSLFNSEAFELLSDLLAYLHRATKVEKEYHNDSQVYDDLVNDRERLEGLYLQKLCHIVVHHPFDYEFVSNSHLIVRAIEQLDEYSRTTQHTIVAMLSTIAIEARVIPYAELAAVNTLVRKNVFRTHSMHALLTLMATLLQFDDVYHEVLRSVGLVSTLVGLFLDQTNAICAGARSAQLRVEYPTSAVSDGPLSDVVDNSVDADEKVIVSLLASHCHQKTRRYDSHHDAMDTTAYLVLIDVMRLFADGVPSDAVAMNDDYYERTICGLPMLACLCILIGDATFQQDGLSLWTSIARVSLILQRDSTILRNTVNSLLQAVRYVTLTIYFPEDSEGTLTFPMNMAVLQGALAYLASLLRLDSLPTTTTTESEAERKTCHLTDDVSIRDRVFAALVECDIVLSLLGVLCAMTNKWRLDATSKSSDEATATCSATMLSLQSIFSIVTTNAEAERRFCSFISFGSFGDLISNLLSAHANVTAMAEPALHAANNGDVSETASLSIDCVWYCIGFSVGDNDVACLRENRLSTAVQVQDDCHAVALRYPEFFAIGMQLLSLWADELDVSATKQMVATFLHICTFPGNAHRLASANSLEVILRSFTMLSPRSKDSSIGKDDSLSQALLWENNVFHASIVSIVETIALASVSLTAVDYWVRMLLRLCHERSWHSRNSAPTERSLLTRPSERNAMDPNVSVVNAAASSATLQAATPGLTLMRLLVKLTSATFERSKGAPAIEFDVSSDGYGCLQIPDINVRPASSIESGASAPSLSTFSHNSKVWPPPDGYSVMVWFQVDSVERKEEREKLYRECFMSNTCIHCRVRIQDEHVLKCSHRACRGCIEALVNSGGECVVCNPPMFYLFRFRSSDGKSASEAFLKGGKLYMRTSLNRASAYQFTHTPIKTNEWQHVVFTHARQRFQSSMVSCYLNGLLQENVKMSYPSSITGSQPLSGLVGVPSQARRCSSVRWKLGPFYLLDLPVAAPVINAVFAAGPSYDRLFSGAAGNNEIGITFDHLNILNMAMFDSYMWDPVRSLINSVDAERGHHNKLLRRSLSLASAASSTAAAIVQDIKLSANVFARIPSAAPLVHVPLSTERILVTYSAQHGVAKELSIIPCSKLDGRPSGHLMGGTTVCEASTIADAMFDICSSGCLIAYGLLNEASTAEEVELALTFLWLCVQSNSRNLAAMEHDHGYGVVNYLLHQKASLLTDKCLQTLFRIVGVDIELETKSAQQWQQLSRDSAIRNVQALQYFILDYSMWQKAPAVTTAKLLFSTLYACLAAEDDAIRERNRAQLQSMSVVRQLLYVLMDPTVTNELLQVIVDVVLVCLTNSSRDSIVEANFADVTSFLSATLSQRFGHDWSDVGVESGGNDGLNVNDTMSIEINEELATMERHCEHFQTHSLASPTARLCLSPRGSQPKDPRSHWSACHAQVVHELPAKLTTAHLVSHQSKIQELLLNMLLQAVQKIEVKESKENGEDSDNRIVDIVGGSSSKASVSTTNSSGSGGASRMQLPAASRLTGFRKYLGFRWLECFLFPGDETEFSLGITPSTVVAALRLLCTLLGNSRYENAFKKEGYYRLLAQGLPCHHTIFSNVVVTATTCSSFQKMWYALFSVLLGPPIDGMPDTIRLEIEHLSKDFGVNIQRDQVMNSSILNVIMTLLRRHFNDPVALMSMMGASSPDDVSTKDCHLGLGSKHSNVMNSSTAPVDIFHLEVLDFLQYLFESMPSLHALFISGNEKMRLELMEELTRLICGAARFYLVEHYPDSQKHIEQVLDERQVAVTDYNLAVGRVELAEAAAATDSSGNDPFLHHSVAARGLRLSITLLMKFLLHLPNGHDLVEEYVDGTASSAVLLPPLHPGLLLRYQSLIVMGLLDHIRAKFNDEEVLAKSKYFSENVREFVRFVVGKMRCWQRAQHGDCCPTAFACCGRAHFVGGPSRLLEMILFVLVDTSIGPASGSGSASLAPSSSFGGMLSDKLSKGKRRRPFRHLMGRMTRTTDLDNLLAELYTALNGVILHVLHGRGAEVEDKELVAMLQQIHIHGEIVLSSHNNNDRKFVACLCRYLLQLLADSGASVLQGAAALVWIDLMLFQQDAIGDLLVVEIRTSGAAPYSVNLMKNGFDMLLECATTSRQEEKRIVQSVPFVKFAKWLELVGPPLKELENNLDRIFINTVVETKETVHELWAAYHKKAAHRNARYEKQYQVRYEWFVSMENEYIESLLRAQQREFRRQLKWRQDRVDRQKFIARQWDCLQLEFQCNTLGLNDTSCGKKPLVAGNRLVMTEIADQSRHEVVSLSNRKYAWRLDFTEGPYRMRKRLSRKLELSEFSRNLQDQQSSPSRLNASSDIADIEAALKYRGAVRRSRVRRRRYSESDANFSDVQSRHIATRKQCITRQQSDDKMSVNSRQEKVLATSASLSNVLVAKERGRKGSFEALLAKYVKGERHALRASFSRLATRRESSSDRDNLVDDKDEKLGQGSGLESSNMFENTVDPGNVMMEGFVDEKLRPLLMPDDEITDIYDCLRIDGMDSCPGVFLLCKDHVYIVDNYQRLSQPSASSHSDAGHTNDDFQIRVTEVPEGSTTLMERRLSWHFQDFPRHCQAPISRNRDIHQCRFWAYDDITELHKRRYQLRHVALEIFANDGRNYLVTLESPEQRELVFHALLSKCPNVQGAASGLDGVSGRGDLYSQLRKLLRNSMTERWVQGDISNFAYLMHLNTLAGRSYNDFTQYPVFPWVLADYDSEMLDLSDPGVYRDLKRPMGALRREEEFRARYEGLMESALAAGGESAVDHPLSLRPFHYGTHYSSAAITLHYLMRLEPFTSHFRRLHDGKFDHADRLFTSIVGAWKSAAGFEGAQNGTQDVKELIPEFFYLPEFLENVNECAFGTSQTGITVGDVELPRWANGSSTEFVRLNRAALESPHVSANLHHWIDLIFGVKQQGPAAVEACNVFYHLTYEGSVDLDTITDASTKRAILDQITEFGQTPSQLFRTPHPVRAASVSMASSTMNTPLSSSLGPLIESANAQNENDTSHASESRVATSPMTTRAALANSFLEGGEIITRMQTILSNGPGLSGTFAGAAEASIAPVLENSALLQSDLRRQVPVNPLLTFYRHEQHTSGLTSSSIHRIAWTSGGVGRDEKVVTVGPKCLLIPPRHNEYLAWGFHDRSVKVIATGAIETGSHGSDSKIIACLELDVEIDVATITTDGRIVITSCPGLPAMRMWRFNSTRRSLAASLAAASGSSSASATASSAAAVATSLAAASALSAPHRRRTYTSVGSSSTRSLTLIGSINAPAHEQRITALQANRAYSVLVSGCAGGIAILWDLNRRRFVRQLPSMWHHDEERPNGITAICINEVTGDIILAAGSTFGVYSINGVLRVRLEDHLGVFQVPSAVAITSLAVNRGEACEWSTDKHLVTGHADGSLCIWAYSQAGERAQGEQVSKTRRKDEWILQLQGRHKATSGHAITAIYVTPDKRKLFTGTQDGQLSGWTVSISTSSSLPRKPI